MSDGQAVLGKNQYIYSASLPSVSLLQLQSCQVQKNRNGQKSDTGLCLAISEIVICVSVVLLDWEELIGVVFIPDFCYTCRSGEVDQKSNCITKAILWKEDFECKWYRRM